MTSRPWQESGGTKCVGSFSAVVAVQKSSITSSSATTARRARIEGCEHRRHPRHRSRRQLRRKAAHGGHLFPALAHYQIFLASRDSRGLRRGGRTWPDLRPTPTSHTTPTPQCGTTKVSIVHKKRLIFVHVDQKILQPPYTRLRNVTQPSQKYSQSREVRHVKKNFPHTQLNGGGMVWEVGSARIKDKRERAT